VKHIKPQRNWVRPSLPIFPSNSWTTRNRHELCSFASSLVSIQRFRYKV